MAGYRYDQLRVLVVDDNVHMRRLISAVLTAFGIKTVYDADSAEAAWEILLDTPVDIILVDWVMNGMSGLELTEKIRTAPDSPNPFMPVIILTGHTSIQHVHAARDAGANEFLAKPVSAKALLSRLAAVIEHPRPFVRSKQYFGPCRRRRRPEGQYSGPERRAAELSKQDSADAA